MPIFLDVEKEKDFLLKAWLHGRSISERTGSSEKASQQTVQLEAVCNNAPGNYTLISAYGEFASTLYAGVSSHVNLDSEWTFSSTDVVTFGNIVAAVTGILEQTPRVVESRLREPEREEIENERIITFRSLRDRGQTVNGLAAGVRLTPESINFAERARRHKLRIEEEPEEEAE